MCLGVISKLVAVNRRHDVGGGSSEQLYIFLNIFVEKKIMCIFLLHCPVDTLKIQIIFR